MAYLVKIKLSTMAFDTMFSAMDRAQVIIHSLSDADLTGLVDRVEILDDCEGDAYDA